jgi:hypothetical protein
MRRIAFDHPAMARERINLEELSEENLHVIKERYAKMAVVKP